MKSLKSWMVGSVFVLVMGALYLIPALGQRANDPQKSPVRASTSRLDFSDQMDAMLEAVVAQHLPDTPPLVVGQPSVIPTEGCVDGVCAQLVHSAREYFATKERGVHRFKVIPVGNAENTLFLVVAGDNVVLPATPMTNAQVLQFYGATDESDSGQVAGTIGGHCITIGGGIIPWEVTICDGPDDALFCIEAESPHASVSYCLFLPAA
jgi:hypothetical protein